jgi:SAM-dependent methyltransferase
MEHRHSSGEQADTNGAASASPESTTSPQAAALSEPYERQEYDDRFVSLLEAVWGEGFMSPGGGDEVALILDGLDVAGRAVLDIGCGLGAGTFLIAERYAAKSVVGIDVEATVIEKATHEAARRGLDGRVRFQLVDPGPLPFADSQFDLIFSKDAIAHIPAKDELARELFRVLGPGGVFAASDWMSGADGPMSPGLERYASLLGDHGVGLASPDRYFAALRAAGFEQISYRNRIGWYRALANQEIADLRGPLYEGLADTVGKELLDHEITVWEALCAALETSELGPGHWRATRPAV